MSIPFTQYLLPHGRESARTIDMPEEIEALAQRFINAGGWFESETPGEHKHVHLTACWERPDGDHDIVSRVVLNGPDVVTAVEEIVREACRLLDQGKLDDDLPQS